MGWFEIIFLAVIAPPVLWVCIDFYIIETLRDAKRDREES
jgi:hypothetical protein